MKRTVMITLVLVASLFTASSALAALVEATVFDLPINGATRTEIQRVLKDAGGKLIKTDTFKNYVVYNSIELAGSDAEVMVKFTNAGQVVGVGYNKLSEKSFEILETALDRKYGVQNKQIRRQRFQGYLPVNMPMWNAKGNVMILIKFNDEDAKSPEDVDYSLLYINPNIKTYMAEQKVREQEQKRRAVEKELKTVRGI